MNCKILHERKAAKVGQFIIHNRTSQPKNRNALLKDRWSKKYKLNKTKDVLELCVNRNVDINKSNLPRK